MYGDQYLAHYGILGMKWGVRRYQNYDGSYTRKGLERYRKSKQNYDSAKQKLAESRSTRDRVSIKSAKSELKIARRQLNKDYDKLKRDYKADQGKKLYQSGKTITDNNQLLGYSQTAVTVGAGLVSKYLSESGNTRLAGISGPAILIGGTAINAILYMSTKSKNNKLRAYYGH